MILSDRVCLPHSGDGPTDHCVRARNRFSRNTAMIGLIASATGVGVRLFNVDDTVK